jgi:hypothetical protein
MDIIQLKKCGMTANNKLLVLIIKSQLNKKSVKAGVQTSAKCCVLQSAFKIAGKVLVKKLERLDK